MVKSSGQASPVSKQVEQKNVKVNLTIVNIKEFNNEN